MDRTNLGFVLITLVRLVVAVAGAAVIIVIMAIVITIAATAVIVTIVAIVIAIAAVTVAAAIMVIVGMVTATTVAAVIVLLVSTTVATVAIGDVEHLADIDLVGVGNVIGLGQLPHADMVPFGDLAQGVARLDDIAIVTAITIVVVIARRWCSHHTGRDGSQDQRQDDGHEQTSAAKPASKEIKTHVQLLLSLTGLT
jgi:hypothetical protein